MPSERDVEAIGNCSELGAVTDCPIRFELWDEGHH
jgi:hypothetical protein